MGEADQEHRPFKPIDLIGQPLVAGAAEDPGDTSLEMTRKYVNMAFGDVKDKHRRFFWHMLNMV